MAEGGGGAADSYIGSLISLTSKSEIRYEGILYTVDTENSNIALQNVRSFGTEGRKKDGPQIPTSDKVYDYIIFRGTDIKDLQVKLSPPAQIHNDPAIISVKSQHSQPVPVSPAYIPPAAGLAADSISSSYLGVQSAAFRSALPLYQPAGSGLGLWGPPPPLGPNGTGLAMPMYPQGFYKPPGGHQPLEQLQFKLQPPPSLPSLPALQPHSEQHQPAMPPSLSTSFSQSMPSHTSATQESDIAEGSSTSSLVTPVSLPAIISAPQITSGQETTGPVAISSSFAVARSASSSLVADLPGSIQGISTVTAPPFQILQKVFDEGQIQPVLEYQVVGSAEVSSPICVSIPMGMPIATTSAQKVQSAVQKVGSALGKGPIVHRQASKHGQKVTELPKSASHPIISGVHQPSTQPLLPLPVPLTQHKPLLQNNAQGNGAVVKSNYIRRGRGRGSGMGRAGRGVHPMPKFLEDFDFIAMNEKFNKDEVWDELGKEELKDKGAEGVEVESLANGGIESDELDKLFNKSLPDIPKKPVYVKDDFFDALSCDALDREGGRSERTKFSEQRKIDTETFGSFPLRSRGGRRGRHGGRGGRGGLHGRNAGRGRGNGYGGRAYGDGRAGPVVYGEGRAGPDVSPL